MIFTAAADDDLEPIVESAFENVEQGIFYLLISLFPLLTLYAEFISTFWNY